MSDSFVTPWTIACQALLSMGFPRQKYWNGLPFPSAGDLSSPGIEPTSPALAGGYSTTQPPGKPTDAYSLLVIRVKRYRFPSFEFIFSFCIILF